MSIWQQLDRFLILGSCGGSYYANERSLTTENAEIVRLCAADDPNRTVVRVVEMSQQGRAPKNDEAIFALAMLCSIPETRQLATEAIPLVCRTGTHLFDFLENLKHFRGWSRSLRRAVSQWYTEKSPSQLAYQLSKYQSRNGWTHRDVLRKCHAKSDNESINLALGWAAGKREILGPEAVGDLTTISAMEAAQRADSADKIVQLIRDYDLVRECIPTQFLNSKEVWEALLDKMPMGAMVRNLGKMANVGLITPMSSACQLVCARLRHPELVRKSRLHPMSILLASRVYAAGRGIRGSLTWAADSSVTAALDDAFHLAFDNVVPTNKRYLLGVDVSGSMGCQVGGTFLQCREAAAAMSLVTVRSEPLTHAVAFTGALSQLQQLSFTTQTDLHQALNMTHQMPFGRTDCALPMLYALRREIEADVFVVYTDSETWCGQIHAVQALQMYREKTGIPAKLIVVGMVSNGFTIADPNDGGMLDVVGLSTDVPAVMREFVVND